MATEGVFYFSVEEAVTLHILLMREWQEVYFGIDRKDLLESALNRPKHAASFENASLIRQAATLCFGLVKNHPWLGGNKRTATYLMEVFLVMNGLELTAGDKEIIRAVLKVESGEWMVSELEDWLLTNVTNN